LKPHHHALVSWFNEFRVKDKLEEDASSDDSDEDLTNNFLGRMVDHPDDTRTEREL